MFWYSRLFSSLIVKKIYLKKLLLHFSFFQTWKLWNHIHTTTKSKDADSMEKSWAFHQRWSKLRTSYFACLKSVPTPIFQNWCSEYPKASASALRTNIHVYMPKQPLIFRKCSTFSHKSIIHCLKKDYNCYCLFIILFEKDNMTCLSTC